MKQIMVMLTCVVLATCLGTWDAPGGAGYHRFARAEVY